MPNHVQSELTITGDNVKAVLAHIVGKEENQFIDLNTIIPMPEGMHLETPSSVIKAAKRAMFVPDRIGRQESLYDHETKPLDMEDEHWKQFIQCQENLKNHGYAYWYDWAIDNWGTKWNAYSQEIDGGVIRFETAWSGIPALIERLCKVFPGNTFDYKWADEDTGSNVGHMIFMDGVQFFENIPESQSREAYDLRFELCPSDKEYYKLVGDTYEYDDEAAEV